MLYDFMGVVTLLVFVVAAVVGADRAWRFLSRKRELRASDLRGSGGHRKPPLGEKRAVRWDALNKAKLAIDEAKRDEDLPPGIVRSGGGLWRKNGNILTAWPECDQLALERAAKPYRGVPGADGVARGFGSPDGMAGAPAASHARDPFAAWDGKRFVPNDGVVMVPRSYGATSYVPSPKAPQVPANPMFDWRGTGGARGDMPQEWVDRVTEAGLVATNPVDVRRQAAEAGIRFNSQTGRGERIRETGPEAKWVP